MNKKPRVYYTIDSNYILNFKYLGDILSNQYYSDQISKAPEGYELHTFVRDDLSVYITTDDDGGYYILCTYRYLFDNNDCPPTHIRRKYAESTLRTKNGNRKLLLIHLLKKDAMKILLNLKEYRYHS